MFRIVLAALLIGVSEASAQQAPAQSDPMAAATDSTVRPFGPVALSSSRLRHEARHDQFQPPMKKSMPLKVEIILVSVALLALILGISLN